ncbi:hypothetical protein VB780_08015 [Leptolyngbya sp. CCNP1308]|uniref:hypothetical protein n=1 Tax=Leptolyngbya sp. CCNP1308 TaxID=3110255 RepID=UPI002B1ED107|nr:hypothetical protein [Leptolyngbya sp. CCNP1308]MEA5448507.1 hypothetical protein [Leptolyngbya sp. CCNP1308]
MNNPRTLPKVSARILYPDRADRLRALKKIAGHAAQGSAVHWRRLRRLPAGDKAALWAELSPETQAALKAQAASLDEGLRPPVT